MHMDNIRSWTAILFIGSWLCFALIALFFEAAWSSPMNTVKSVVGLVGAAISCILIYSKRPWVFFGCLTLGGVLLITYTLELVLRVWSYLIVDPEFGVLRTIWLKVSTSFLVAMKLAEDGFLLRAAIEFYWMLGMPLLQVVIAVLIIYSFSSRRAQ